MAEPNNDVDSGYDVWLQDPDIVKLWTLLECQMSLRFRTAYVMEEALTMARLAYRTGRLDERRAHCEAAEKQLKTLEETNDAKS